MGLFEMVVAVVLIATGGKVVQDLVGALRPKGNPAGDAKLRQLQEELLASENRIAYTEERVAELSEKVVFMEKLLANPERSGRSQ